MSEAQQMSGQDPVDLVIEPRSRDLGGFSVRRILPYAKRRLVGPVIFLDEMGPAEFPAGSGIDVRPHPHIGLATVTYLFEGEIMHRDSLGVVQPIRPGAVNWMTAGRGIVHSERTGEEERARDTRLHGMQSWIALPQAEEETEPSFTHTPTAELPEIERPGVWMRLIAGSAYGATSPVKVFSEMFYLHAEMTAGASLSLPDEHAERALYLVSGRLAIAGKSYAPNTMVVFREGEPVELLATAGSRVMLLGGAPIDGQRHIWWNFVSSSPERLEQAKADWKAGHFPKVPGEDEFIPLPED